MHFTLVKKESRIFFHSKRKKNYQFNKIKIFFCSKIFLVLKFLCIPLFCLLSPKNKISKTHDFFFQGVLCQKNIMQKKKSQFSTQRTHPPNILTTKKKIFFFFENFWLPFFNLYFFLRIKKSIHNLLSWPIFLPF